MMDFSSLSQHISPLPDASAAFAFPQPSTPQQQLHRPEGPPLSLPSLSSDSQSQTSLPFTNTNVTKTVSVDTSTTNNSKKRGRRTKIQVNEQNTISI